MNSNVFIVPAGKNIRLKDFDPKDTGSFKSKEEAFDKLEKDIISIAALQNILFAQDQYALLIILQAMDAAGKDGVIKHVMSGLNPQGCQVHSFKAPSAEELDHDFLWRCMKALPERGKIGIFNRSYYEEVTIVRVHPDLLQRQKLPDLDQGKNRWNQRYEAINHFEHYLFRNGVVVLKFFLHLSKDEQRQRFMERIEQPDKNWKLSVSDVQERMHWEEYVDAYEQALRHTSTKWAPWYVIPADHKWFTRMTVADILLKTLKSLDLSYPKVSKKREKELQIIKRQLEHEKPK
jgi:PPK2 family polyphosphate:nucleotide phosphotransferase